MKPLLEDKLIENVQSKTEKRYGLTIVFSLDQIYSDQNLIEVLQELQNNLYKKVNEVYVQRQIHGTIIPIIQSQKDESVFKERMKGIDVDNVKQYLENCLSKGIYAKVKHFKINTNGDIVLVIQDTTNTLDEWRNTLRKKFGIDRKNKRDKNKLYVTLGYLTQDFLKFDEQVRTKKINEIENILGEFKKKIENNQFVLSQNLLWLIKFYDRKLESWSPTGSRKIHESTSEPYQAIISTYPQIKNKLQVGEISTEEISGEIARTKIEFVDNSNFISQKEKEDKEKERKSVLESNRLARHNMKALEEQLKLITSDSNTDQVCVENMNLTGNELKELGLAINKNHKISRLKLTFSSLNDDDVKILVNSLKENKNLRSLDLSSNNISGEGLLELVNIEYLKVLDISWNPNIGSDDFAKFVKTTNVVELFANNIGIDASCSRAILENDKLLTLEIRLNKFKANQTEFINQHIKRNLKNYYLTILALISLAHSHPKSQSVFKMLPKDIIFKIFSFLDVKKIDEDEKQFLQVARDIFTLEPRKLSPILKLYGHFQGAQQTSTALPIPFLPMTSV